MKTPKDSVQFNNHSLNLIKKIIFESISTTEANKSQSSSQQLDPKKVTDILNKLDLPQTSLNKKIIKNLIKYQLPLDQELLMKIKQSIPNTDQNLTKIIEAITLLKKLNLNLNKSNIKLLTRFLTEKPDITTELKKLINETKNMNDISDKIKKFILNPKAKDFTGKKLKSKISNLGLDLEKNLLTDELKPETNLKLFLFTLKNNNHQVLNSIIDSIIYNLTSQKLIMHQNENSDTSFLYLQLPLQMDKQQLTTGHLTIYRHKKNNNSRKENDNFRLILRLETDNLGLMNIELNFKNRNLNLNIKTKLKKTLELIKSEIETLKTKINQLNYQIQNINYATITSEKETFDLQLESEILKTNPLKLKEVLHNIDFTV